MNEILLILMASAATSFLAGFPVHAWLVRSQIIDLPNERSSHIQPTARGGGIAIVVSLLAGSIIVGGLAASRELLIWFIIPTLSLAVVSFFDDQKPLPTGVRFCAHALAAASVLYALSWAHPQLALSIDVFWQPPLWFGFGILFLWLSGYTNAFNFMDGINGIASGQAFITAAGSGLLVGGATSRWSELPILLAFVIAGSAAGFLPHNFPRARMFMGDVGSAPLGFLLASLTLWMAATYGWWLLIPLALLHANFVLDTAITLCRRILRGERWYSAHREHFYQRLVRSGKSHTLVTAFEMGLQVIVLMLTVAYPYVRPSARLALICTVIGIWLAFFWYCEAQFRDFCREQISESQPTKDGAVVKA